MAERLFTPEEANALVPRLRPLLAALREAYHEHGFARAQWEELEALVGPSAPGAGAGASAPRSREDEEELAAWRAKADALGARRRDGSLALLCYRDDEDAIRFWHDATSGFAGRRPLDEL